MLLILFYFVVLIFLDLSLFGSERQVHYVKENASSLEIRFPNLLASGREKNGLLELLSNVGVGIISGDESKIQNSFSELFSRETSKRAFIGECGMTFPSSIFVPSFLDLLVQSQKQTILEGQWERIPNDMPSPREGLSACAVNGKLFVIGGFDPNNNITPATEMFDPATGQWEKCENMPTPRGVLVTAVHNGKVIAIAGREAVKWIDGMPNAGSSAVEEFDPISKTWREKNDLPTTISYPRGVQIGRKVYFFGGRRNTIISSEVWAYDLETETLDRMNDLPLPTLYPAVCAAEGIAYIIGGYTSDDTNIPRSTVYAFDPADGKFREKREMPTARIGLCAEYINGKILAMGGVTQSLQVLNKVEIYDLKTDEWEKEPGVPMQTERGFFDSALLRGKIYTIGGSKVFLPLVAVADGEIFTPEGWGVKPAGEKIFWWGRLKEAAFPR